MRNLSFIKIITATSPWTVSLVMNFKITPVLLVSMIGFGGPPASGTPDVELGNRANKVKILRNDNSIEIKPKGWLGKRDWREINEVLLRNGFEWLSSG